jgi:hypothetical protein
MWSVALATLVLAAPNLHADIDADPGRWSYRTEVGLLLPSAKSEPRLSVGPHVLAAVQFEMTQAFYLGTYASYDQSPDELRTRVASFGFNARVSPNVDLSSFYVIAAAGGYRAYYDPERPELQAPGTRLRPGASFGVGLDLASTSQITLTFNGTYHGVFTRGTAGRNIAIEYFTLGLSAWFRPSGS